MDIPRLGLSAPVVVVGTEADGAMGSPTNAVDIGWWQGRRVGEGNALFAAHHDWKGRLGSFYNLADLEKGDEIVVRGEGRSLVFLVAGKAQVDGDADPLGILTDTTEPIVTLITCGGPFDRSIGHHLERVVVQAVLAPVQT
jgi:sortase (surface protein transpeptidase)